MFRLPSAAYNECPQAEGSWCRVARRADEPSWPFCIRRDATVDLIFEWDEEKARAKQSKHGVPFDEGKTVFNDPFAITDSDPDHSAQEERWLDIGLSYKDRLLVVWYTEGDGKIRIIGCREATKAERRSYEDDRIR